MAELVADSNIFQVVLREARLWSARSKIPLITGTLGPENKQILQVFFTEAESRYPEFFKLAETLGAIFMIAEEDALQESDVEEAMAVAVEMNATPEAFSQLWACREHVNEVVFTRLSFVEPRTQTVFHLELRTAAYDWVFNTRDLLEEWGVDDDDSSSDKAKA